MAKKDKLSPEEQAKLEKQKKKDKAKKDKADRKKEKRGVKGALRETMSELKKVRWPTMAHAVKQTGVVLGVVVIFSIVLFGIDQGLSALYDLLTRGLETPPTGI